MDASSQHVRRPLRLAAHPRHRSRSATPPPRRRHRDRREVAAEERHRSSGGRSSRSRRRSPPRRSARGFAQEGRAASLHRHRGFLVIGALGCMIDEFGAQTEVAIVVGVVGIIALIWIGIGLVRIVARAPAADHRGRQAQGAPPRAQGVHPTGRGRPAADAAERDRCRAGAHRGHHRQRPDHQDLREAASLRGALRPREGVGGRARQVLRPVPPDWYDGTNIERVQRRRFAAGVGSISSSVASSFSGSSSSSSSSGGSGGGGSSGGGGGGGGGGGW